MSLDVTSWYIGQIRSQRSAPKRRFLIGGSDYSAQVLRWPTLRYKAGTIDLGTTALRLSNIDRSFQFFVDCEHSLTTSCEISLGFTHSQSGDEHVVLFQGAPSHLAYGRGGTELRLQMQGKTKRLSDASLGSDIESGGLDFTDSSHYPSDLAWTLITCHGEMSSVASESNPDIDYPEWLAWRDENVIRDVRVQAYLTGERIYQVLNSLAIMDAKVISFQNNRLRFKDEFQPYEEVNSPFPHDKIIDLQLSLDPSRIVNHFVVEAGYDASKSKFTAQFTKVNSESQARFGRKSGRYSSRGVWFATGGDARYLAEDRVRFGKNPEPTLKIGAPLAGGVEYTLGDVVSITHSYFDLQARAFQIVSQSVDLDRGRVDIEFLRANHRPWQFQSTVSSENLLVRTLAAVGSDSFLAINESLGNSQVFRSGSDGGFQSTDFYASAILAINDQEILFGGEPSSDATQAVIQRSSDSGSSSTVVSSLAANITKVHDFFEVKSGTYLASTNSGGIYRSTDGGSSWNLTQTISGAYYVQRFFSPYSGTAWGGTGYSDYSLGKGLFIWESQDEGITWAPIHHVYSSGNYFAQGFHHLTNSEFLLAHYGDSTASMGVLRSDYTSPSSIGWTEVISMVSFTNMVATTSGHLLFGFYEEITLNGGTVYRSVDQGSSWMESSRITKQGNIRLVEKEDGTLEAFVSRMTVGARTDLYRNFEPNQIF